MTARMVLLGLVALALTRPFWTPKESAAATAKGRGGAASRRDVVLVIDGSASMDRKMDGTSPREQAIAWSRDFLKKLAPGSTVAVLVARDRVQPLVATPSFDLTKVDKALGTIAASRGSSDLPAAMVDGLSLLEATENPARDIIVLTDGQKRPWRTDEPPRWALLRELHRDFTRRLGVTPAVWSVTFGTGLKPKGADGAVGPLELPRTLVPPQLPILVRTAVANAGPGSLTRTVELLIDGQPAPGAAQVVGPVPVGGTTPVEFKTALTDPGSHVLTVRLAPGDDPLAANDEASRPVEVTKALPVLLVDGEPGLEPLTSETDFLRAALAPTGDDTPQVAATVVKLADFKPEAVQGQSVVVLANVDRLDAGQMAAIAGVLDAGGGVLVAPGKKTDAAFWNEQIDRNGTGWLPARLGDARGVFSARKAEAHPSPPTFQSPSLAPFGTGDAPALAEADLFSYRVLTPATRAPAATVLARLDTGDPWIVERPFRKGRVVLLAGPVDAEGGTLPVNPDFVPLMHELVYHLADAASSRSVRPGEPIVVDLDPAPPADVKTCSVTTPTGETLAMPIEREGGRARARLEAAYEPGIYTVSRPAGPLHVAVESDPRESDLTPLADADQKRLADGWPLSFVADPNRIADLLLVTGPSQQHPIWRFLVLAALMGLCLEIALTRQLVKSRGLADVGPEERG